MVCCSESSKSGEPCESGEQATSVSLVMGPVSPSEYNESDEYQ